MTSRRPTNLPKVVEAGAPFRFKKGVSGNPSGRPKALREVSELAREHSVEAIQRLVDLMRQDKNDRVALDASIALLDRAFGKPAVSVELKSTLAIDEIEQALKRGRERLAPPVVDIDPQTGEVVED